MPPGPTLLGALGLRWGEVVALVGGGGKTTALYRLLAEAAGGAEEAPGAPGAAGAGHAADAGGVGRAASERGAAATAGRARGRALGTTTTRLWPPEPGQVDAAVEADDLDAAAAALRALPTAARRVLLTRGRAADGKLLGVPPGWIARLVAAAADRPSSACSDPEADAPGTGGWRLVAVEADGSAGRPVKAPAAHEPVLPSRLDCLVPVAGADAVGAPLGPAIAHRPGELARQGAAGLGRPLAAGEPLAPAVIAAALLHPRGNLRRLPPEARVVPLVTRLGGGRHRPAAMALAEQLVARGARRVVLGDLGGPLGPAGPLTVVEAPPSRVSAILLAAGRGARMGGSRPKPLLPLTGRPLLHHVLAAALASGVAEVVVVLGHEAGTVGAAVAGFTSLAPAADDRPGPPRPRLACVTNPRYTEGQGTSVAAGVAAASADATGYLFLLADQPLVRAPLIDRLLAEHLATPERILVPTCEGRRGNPVLFPAGLRPALVRLEGERGGRALLERAGEQVRFVDLDDPAVITDLDTPEDLARLDAATSDQPAGPGDACSRNR